MRALRALIRRELIEHRAAFVYVPIGILVGVTCAILGAIATSAFEAPPEPLPTGAPLYQDGIAAVFSGWAIYLGLALMFYYADAFSADRRNNALLFWKSMPQTDLKVLSSKALAGVTVFPLLIAGFATLSAALTYPLLLLVSRQLPAMDPPAFAAAVVTLLQMTLLGSIYLLLNVLWYAPFLAWVAALSTLFRRWSIAVAFLIPGLIVLVEHLVLGFGHGRHPIAEFIGWRMDGMFAESGAFPAIAERSAEPPMVLLMSTLGRIHWVHLGLGLLFAVGAIYLASEYRRRRIEA